MAGSAWTEEEDAFLREASSSRTAAEIGRVLGRTTTAVRARRKTIGAAKPRAPRVDWNAPTVVCSKCEQAKSPKTDYYPDTDGKRARVCKDCRRAEKNRRYTENIDGYRDRERARLLERRDARAQWTFQYRLRQFNLTEAEYEAMCVYQGGRCAVCWRPERKIHQTTGEVQRLAIDHDHRCCPGNNSCGKCVRGLLCASCNQILGKVEEEGVLEGIVRYLTDS